jgi:hypothetical protein
MLLRSKPLDNVYMDVEVLVEDGIAMATRIMSNDTQNLTTLVSARRAVPMPVSKPLQLVLTPDQWISQISLAIMVRSETVLD